MFQNSEIVNMYKKDITSLQKKKSFEKLSLDKEIELGTKIQNSKGSIQNRYIEQLISPHLPYVIDIAMKMYSSRETPIIITEDDFISWGNEGILKAAMIYDPKKRNRFLTHAKAWIQQSIRQNLHENKKTIYHPTAHYQNEFKQKKVIEQFYAKNGYKPSENEVLPYVNTLNNVEYIEIDYNKNTHVGYSIDTEINDQDNRDRLDFIVSCDENIEYIEKLNLDCFYKDIQKLLKSDYFTFSEEIIFTLVEINEIKLTTIVESYHFKQYFNTRNIKINEPENVKNLIDKRDYLISIKDKTSLDKLIVSKEWEDFHNDRKLYSKHLKLFTTDKIREINNSAKDKMRILSKKYLSEYNQ